MKSIRELALIDQHSRATDFQQLARLILRCTGDTGSPWSTVDVLAQNERASDRLQRVCKAAVSAGTLVDPQTGPIADLKVVANGFIASLANVGVFDALLPSMIRVPLQTPQIRISTTALIGSTPQEGQSKPITEFTMGSDSLTRRKSDCIIVISDSLANNLSAAASSLLSRELQKGVIASTDLEFLTDITDGLTPLGAGTDLLADLATAFEAMTIDASSALFLVLDPGTTASLALRADAGFQLYPQLTVQGGSIAGIPVLVSDAAVATGPMLVDASGIAADSETVSLDISRHASPEMVDATTMSAGGSGSPSAPVPAQTVSLWQTNSRGLRASRFFGFQKIRSDAVQLLQGGW